MNKSNTKRLFTAIVFNEEIHRKMADVISQLKKYYQHADLKWSKNENIHLTFRFLGNVDKRQIPELITEIDSVSQSHQPFIFTIGNPMLIPPEKPRVLAFSALLTPELAKLYYEADQAIIKLGFPKDNHAFLPHLTLARARKKTLPPLPDNISFSATQTVNKIILFSSELTSEGSIYRLVHEFQLAVIN